MEKTHTLSPLPANYEGWFGRPWTGPVRGAVLRQHLRETPRVGADSAEGQQVIRRRRGASGHGGRAARSRQGREGLGGTGRQAAGWRVDTGRGAAWTLENRMFMANPELTPSV